jgi:glycosyltransferase involved in cell wall biosynthesis
LKGEMSSVSAVIPVHNGEATIARAIDSALAQRIDRPTEVVVVDDGSTDSTPRILESYGARTKVVTQPNRGPAAARNAGVRASRGDYLAFLDADDQWLPGKLSRTCDVLDRNPHAVLAFSDAILATEEGQKPFSWPDHPPSMAELLAAVWPMSPSLVVMRRNIFDLCGGFCEEFRQPGFEDPYLWLLAREHGEFAHIAEPLIVYYAPPFRDRADKYEPGRKIFIRLVRERYGRRARPLVRWVRIGIAPSLVQRALSQMDAGDRRGALETWMRALRMSPSYFLDARHLRRAIRLRNLKRLFRILVPA